MQSTLLRPRDWCVRVRRAQGDGGDTQILLVDAAAVKLTLYTRLKLLSGAADGDMKAEDAAFLREFYNTTAIYFQALLRTGLKVKACSRPRWLCCPLFRRQRSLLAYPCA